MNPCDATVEGRLGVNSAELDQLDLRRSAFKSPDRNVQCLGARGIRRFPPQDVTRAVPTRDRTTRSPTWSSLVQIKLRSQGSWSNMSSVWGILVPSPQNPGKTPTPPPHLHSINDYFVFNMILGTCGLSAGSESPPVLVLPKGLLASNSVAPKGSRRLLKMTDICAEEPPLCPTGCIFGTHVAHPTCALAAAEGDVGRCWDSVPVTCADRRPRLDDVILLPTSISCGILQPGLMVVV